MSVTQIPSAPDKAIVVGTFPTCSPGRLFDYWTIPQLITQWWTSEAEIEPYGDYSDSGEDQQTRQEHIEGWLYFVGKLQNCIEGQ